MLRKMSLRLCQRLENLFLFLSTPIKKWETRWGNRNLICKIYICNLVSPVEGSFTNFPTLLSEDKRLYGK